MYICYSTRLPLPVAACAAALSAATRIAAGDDPSVGFKVGPAVVRKRVRLAVGDPEALGDWMRIRMAVRFLPIVRDLPLWIPLYRLIWRNHRQEEAAVAPAPGASPSTTVASPGTAG